MARLNLRNQTGLSNRLSGIATTAHTSIAVFRPSIGLGAFLLIDPFRRAKYLANRIGIRAIEVEAINEAARKFFEKYGFLSFKDDPHSLFLHMQVIRMLKLPPM